MLGIRRRRPPALTRAEIDGLIVLLMRIDANVARIADAAEDADGEEET
jgi:hypothetical protein